MVVLRVARHDDHVHQVEEDHDSMRREVRLLAGIVREFEQGKDYDEIRILNAYDHLEETHSPI